MKQRKGKRKMGRPKLTVKRVNLSMAPDMYERLENLARIYGMPVTSLATYFVGKMLYTDTKTNEAITSENVSEAITRVYKSKQ